MGIFDDKVPDLFAAYSVRLQMRDKLVGGTPKDPAILEAWIGKNTGLKDQPEELRRAIVRSLRETFGIELADDVSREEMDDAIAAIAGEKHTVGFKADEQGLFLEERCIKAMLKETTNILFAKEKWGKTGKGPKNFLAERVFNKQPRIYLDRSKPDDVITFIGHTVGPQGPQSSLTKYEVVDKAVLAFDVLVLRDEIEPVERWWKIWVHAQLNGLGSLRSQGYGRFDIEAWDRIPVRKEHLVGVAA